MLEIYESLIQGLLDKGYGSVDNYFAPEAVVGLRKSLLAHYEKDLFRTAAIGKQENLQQKESIRNDYIYWLEHSTTNVFEQAFLASIEGFIQYLNRTCFTGIQDYEFHYAVYEAGSFYKRHSDQFKKGNQRQFSFVCYLTEAWDSLDGGELVLYKEVEGFLIAPLPGRVIFFDSAIEHEVLLSQKQRLSLTGWMKIP